MKFGFAQLLFVLLIAGLVTADYTFVLRPNAQRRAEKDTRKAVMAKELTDLRQFTAGITDMERKITELQQAIAFFESKLPQEKEIDKILKEVWQLAEANRLQTRTIKTLKTERFAGYSEQPIQMTLSGDFYGFYAFLQQMEKLARITRVSQMKLSKITTREGEMTADLTLSIFFESGSASTAVAGTR